MTDAITRQVSKQVKRAMEAANSARPLPHFDYIPTPGAEPSHRSERIPSPRCTDPPYKEQLGRRTPARPSGRPLQGATARSTIASTPYATHSRRTAWLEEQKQTSRPRWENAKKYYEFHEQSGHTTTGCRELKKALHELEDKGQIDRFLKRGPRFLRREQEPAQPQPWEEECSTEVVAIIAGGHAKGMTRST
ncbi:hypothetical protein Cgig2_018567 [Carnegiea gigantea]|uniref:Uncharacterized protein n=1 Tax=Carnegiea gigantea TaxID=171969 RepID=A0A9Q1KMT4_9CARY|nr:hypothetical protein Cgig2_018567 [Carnegiea gigantea]